MSHLSATRELSLLRVGELSQMSGVPTATIRSWEARYNFPTSIRSQGGQRRYDEGQVNLVRAVAKLRAAGSSMTTAIAQARDEASPKTNSFFATLREVDPGLRPHILTKRALRAITTAIEDECMAQATRPLLFGAFQQDGFYRQSEVRWSELARTAKSAVVFANFGESRSVGGRPTEVALPTDSPVLREWVLVCEAPGFSACVAGWELPSPHGTPDRDRRFETVWTLNPASVRAAVRVGIALTDAVGSDVASDLSSPHRGPIEPGSPELHRATALFARVVDYMQDETSFEKMVS